MNKIQEKQDAVVKANQLAHEILDSLLECFYEDRDGNVLWGVKEDKYLPEQLSEKILEYKKLAQ